MEDDWEDEEDEPKEYKLDAIWNGIFKATGSVEGEFLVEMVVAAEVD
jgi:hypothetical protein